MAIKGDIVQGSRSPEEQSKLPCGSRNSDSYRASQHRDYDNENSATDYCHDRDRRGHHQTMSAGSLRAKYDSYKPSRNEVPSSSSHHHPRSSSRTRRERERERSASRSRSRSRHRRERDHREYRRRSRSVDNAQLQHHYRSRAPRRGERDSHHHDDRRVYNKRYHHSSHRAHRQHRHPNHPDQKVEPGTIPRECPRTRPPSQPYDPVQRNVKVARGHPTQRSAYVQLADAYGGATLVQLGNHAGTYAYVHFRTHNAAKNCVETRKDVNWSTVVVREGEPDRNPSQQGKGQDGGGGGEFTN